jgi:hypothetical protein
VEVFGDRPDFARNLSPGVRKLGAFACGMMQHDLTNFQVEEPGAREE